MFDSTMPFDEMNADQLPAPIRKSRSQSVIPLSIRAIKNFPAGKKDLTLFGRPVSLICVVGIIVDIQKSSAKVTYTLEDESGQINAIRWLDVDKHEDDSTMKENNYVRVFGNLRVEERGHYIGCLGISPMNDYFQILVHRLKCIETRLSFEDIRMNKDESNPNRELASSMADLAKSSMPSGSGSSNATTTRAIDGNDKTSLQERIYNIVSNCPDQTNGISVAAIMKQLPANCHAGLKERLEFMVGEGHIYTSIDDVHYLAT